LKPLLEFVVGQFFSERLQDEFAQGLSTPARTLPKPAMNIFRNIFDLKVCHCMRIASAKHARPDAGTWIGRSSLCVPVSEGQAFQACLLNPPIGLRTCMSA
jgi:hypothetical protein